MLSNAWVKLGVGLAIAAATGYFLVAAYGKGYSAGKTEVLSQWSKSQLVAEQAVRELEHTWQGRVDEARTERDVKVKAIESGAARVAANAKRLHSAAIKAERNACKAAAGTEGRSAPPGNMLANVLNRVGERTGKLAAYADELRAALNECRGSWPR